MDTLVDILYMEHLGMGNGLLMVEKSEASRFEEPSGEVKQGDSHFQRTSPIWVRGWWGEEKNI